MKLRTALAIVIALLVAACSTPKLLKAAEVGDLAEVKRLLDAGEPADVWGGDEKLTPLFWAAVNGNAEMATALIARGANVNARSRIGATPLFAAAYWHHEDLVALLLSKGADPSVVSKNGETALHRALARYGVEAGGPTLVPTAKLEAMTTTARLLVERGTDPKAAVPSGETPLHFAAACGHPPLVAFLLDKGAAIEARGTDGVTPLYVAAISNRHAVAELLLARGAQVDARTKSRYTPLLHAARTGAPKLVALFVDKGADVNATDAEGKTPLLEALWTGSLASPAGQKLMVARGGSAAERADLNRRLASVEGRWHDAALLLIDRGADVRAHPADVASPLLLAAVTGDVDVVRELLEHGAPIDEITTGETALHAAVAERQGKVVRLLLEKGADVKVVNRSRRTPLHFAAWYMDDTAVTEALLTRGADVNALDAKGHTPLWYANDAKNQRVAEALRARGGR